MLLHDSTKNIGWTKMHLRHIFSKEKVEKNILLYMLRIKYENKSPKLTCVRKLKIFKKLLNTFYEFSKKPTTIKTDD